MVTAIFIACNREFWTKIETNIKFGGDSQQVLGMNTIPVSSGIFISFENGIK